MFIKINYINYLHRPNIKNEEKQKFIHVHHMKSEIF